MLSRRVQISIIFIEIQLFWIGWCFYKHANQYDWFVWLVIPRGCVIAKLPLVPFVIINLTAGVCMKARFKSNVTKGSSLLAASRLSRGSRKTNGNGVGFFQQQSETFLNKSFNFILFLAFCLTQTCPMCSPLWLFLPRLLPTPWS